jgi:hypothetical protein
MKRFVLISVVLMLTLAFVGVHPTTAQDSASCSPKTVVSTFATAVADDTLDAWLNGYTDSQCEDPIKTNAKALYDAYNEMVVSTEPISEEPCSPDVGIICELFAPVAQHQVEGGDSFVFVNQPADMTDEFTADCKHSGKYGLQITYEVTGAKGNAGWGVQWDQSTTGIFDASSFTNLTLWVQGVEGREKFQIGMKDKNGTEQKVESTKIGVVETGEWTKMTIPLKKYFNKVKTSEVVNLNFGFNINHRNGTICIDDVAFE